MQIAIVTGPTHQIAALRVVQANAQKDGVEFRLDLFQNLDIRALQELRSIVAGKVIFTLRSRKNGGGFLGSDERRLQLTKELLELKPDYFDIEHDTPEDFLNEILNYQNDVKIILSYHNYTATPKHLELILSKMVKDKVYAYKICTTANSFSDSYRMLRFIQKTKQSGTNVIGLCMGEYGRITRVDGIKAGNYLNYTILSNRDKVAPGLSKV
jgi:3-dehydroquinate dehydratase type I